MNTDERVRAAMTDLADGPLPADLAGRALAGARRRRIGLYAGIAVVGIATALVAGLAAGVGPGLAPGVGGRPPGPDRWQVDVDHLETELLPVVQDLELTYYLMQPGYPLDRGPCYVLEYSRGNYHDGDPDCTNVVPFDAQARADFDEVTNAVERSGVAVERIVGHGGWVYVQLKDSSWEYNWQYVYLPDVTSPPATVWPGEEWTHIRGDWWFHRAHDD